MEREEKLTPGPTGLHRDVHTLLRLPEPRGHIRVTHMKLTQTPEKGLFSSKFSFLFPTKSTYCFEQVEDTDPLKNYPVCLEQLHKQTTKEPSHFLFSLTRMLSIQMSTRLALASFSSLFRGHIMIIHGVPDHPARSSSHPSALAFALFFSLGLPTIFLIRYVLGHGLLSLS